MGPKCSSAPSAKLTSYDNAGKSEAYLVRRHRASIGHQSSLRDAAIRGRPWPARRPTSRRTKARSQLAFSAFMTRNLSARGNACLLPDRRSARARGYQWADGRLRVGAGRHGQLSKPEKARRAAGVCTCCPPVRAHEPSYFGDASEEGEDVFLFTRQSLVSQDQDDNVDVYDARVDGGLAGQNSPPASPCESEERCRGVPATAPIFGSPSSMTLVGGGNLAPPTAPSKPVSNQRKAQALDARAEARERVEGMCEEAEEPAGELPGAGAEASTA